MVSFEVAGKTFEGSNRIILICLGEDTSCVAVLLCYCGTVLLFLLWRYQLCYCVTMLLCYCVILWR